MTWRSRKAASKKSRKRTPVKFNLGRKPWSAADDEARRWIAPWDQHFDVPLPESHEEFAIEMLTSRYDYTPAYIEKLDSNMGDIDTDLEKQGWIRVVDSYYISAWKKTPLLTKYISTLPRDLDIEVDTAGEPRRDAHFEGTVEQWLDENT